MKKITNNPDNLKYENIDMASNKVRAIIINNMHITIVDYCNTLMFPGGKVETGENEKDALIRELKEELGLDISGDTAIPFIEYNNYLHNYPYKNGKIINKLVTTKYYIVKTNKKIDLSKSHLSENEKKQSFKVYIESILFINGTIDNYNSNNPRWPYLKKEFTDILHELSFIFKETLEEAVSKSIQEPNSWRYTPESAVYIDHNDEIRLIKNNKKVVDCS